MTSVVDICNMSLGLIGARSSISSINPSDGSNEANYCALYYPNVMRMLLRSAHWARARKQVSATLYKQRFINGQLSTNPPPQPWCYEYLYPADCLKERFILKICPEQINTPNPPLTTGQGQFPAAQQFAGFAKFTPALDTDAQGNPITVFLTDQGQAQLVYTADISQNPDLWDSQLVMAATHSLAAYLVNPLARNKDLFNDMVAGAKVAIDSARATDGNEALPNTDNIPDWVRTRFVSGYGWGSWGGAANGTGGFIMGWDSMAFPGGLTY